MKICRPLAILVCGLSLAESANATIIQWKFEGLTQSYLPGDVCPNPECASLLFSPFDGIVWFDSASPDLISDPYQGLYTFEGRSSGAKIFVNGRLEHTSSRIRFGVGTGPFISDPQWALDLGFNDSGRGLIQSGYLFSCYEYEANPIPNDSLPADPYFPNNRCPDGPGLIWNLSDGPQLGGILTGITRVPEPATLYLLLTGLLGLLWLSASANRATPTI